jgi:YrbI family 3-deoxy-D-manno-octulosonate 8-phosphate phosphatase
MVNKIISFKDIDAFVFDFDGVLTNNMVYIDQNGKESVSCSRADGLAFDVMHKLQKPVYILSTEKNTVVAARAKKLKLKVFQGIGNKADVIKEISERYGFDLKNILYIGNDVNDYNAMKLCGYTACPSDSHKTIKEISNIILKKSGGNGVVRELLEDVFKVNFIQILYSKEN